MPANDAPARQDGPSTADVPMVVEADASALTVSDVPAPARPVGDGFATSDDDAYDRSVDDYLLENQDAGLADEDLVSADADGAPSGYADATGAPSVNSAPQVVPATDAALSSDVAYSSDEDFASDADLTDQADEEPAWDYRHAAADEPKPRPAPIPIPIPAPDDEDEPQEDLLNAVERLRMRVATLSLTLDVDGVLAARQERESLLSQLDDYLLPRLRRRDAPLLAVIGGSTGAGKSTLTNSLVRREVSRSGVLRPTTRSPVLVHHPYDSGAFMSQRILPRLNRITSEGAEPLQPIDPNAPRITGLRLVPHDGLTPGMALIDAPDIDSLVETNRDLAVQLLAAADLWIFVTTAARYADAMPWEMLKQAADRGVAVAVVLDRVPPEALADLRVHLATRLRDRGLGGAPLFTIAETETVDGFLPERVVAPLQQWLRRVAGDERSRAVIADRTLKGIVGSIPARAELLAEAANRQTGAWVELHEDVEQVFGQARTTLLSGLTDGSLLSGDVLNRWQEYLADDALVRRLEGSSNNLSDRVGAAVRRDPGTAQPLDVPVTKAAEASVRSAVRDAMDDVINRWRVRTHGAALLEARGHQLTAVNTAAEIETSLGEWRDTLAGAADEIALRADGQYSVDLTAATDVLFVVTIDAATDRSEGGSPTVAAARRILCTVLGEDSVRTVTSAARADLVSRAALLLDAGRMRLERLLEAGGTDGRRAVALLAAAQAVDEAR